jgi:hypothetical protein
MPSDLREFRTLDLIAAEAAKRPIRRRTVDVLPYEPTDTRPETHLALEGTITVLAARAGSGLMADIREALASNPAETAAVARRLYLQYKGRKRVKLSRAVKTAISQPVFADVVCGDMVLVENLVVPKEIEVAFLPFPYNGGELGNTGFVLVEHPVSEDVDPLDILVLRHMPKLSKAERAAVDKVPAEQRATNVGRGPGPKACSVVLLTLTVLAEAAIVAVTYAITGKVDLEHMKHLDPGDIKKMGSGKSARVLVEKRREYLKKRKTQKKTHA